MGTVALMGASPESSAAGAPAEGAAGVLSPPAAGACAVSAEAGGAAGSAAAGGDAAEGEACVSAKAGLSRDVANKARAAMPARRMDARRKLTTDKLIGQHLPPMTLAKDGEARGVRRDLRARAFRCAYV